MKPESDWPTSRILTDEPPEEFLSSKRQPVHTTIVVETEETVVERLLSRCSSLSKLKRVTAWILRLTSTLQHRTQHTILPQANFLSVEELHRTEMVVIRHLQQQHFPYLSSHKLNTLPRFMQKLHPVCVDGVFRVGGRCLNNLLRRGRSGSAASAFCINGKMTCDPTFIANGFNDHFSNIAVDLVNQLPKSSQHFKEY